MDEEDFAGILVEMGYFSGNYDGVPYYHWFTDDIGRDSRRVREFPLGSSIAMLRDMNALAFAGDQLVLSRRTSYLLEVLRVHRGIRSSMADQKAYKELADVAGADLLGGVFLSPEFVGQIWGADGNKPSDALVRYIEGENAWGVMEPYGAAVVGTGVGDGQPQIIIGLHFSSPGAAEENAVELSRRWSTARLRLMDGLFDMDEPFSAFCAPLESRTIALRDASVLIAKCLMLDHTPATRPTFSPDAFWIVMVEYHELHFLLPDPMDSARRTRSGN